MESLPDDVMLALAGLAGGIVLGMAVRLGRFCSLGAIEDWVYGQSTTRLRMWSLAIAVAIAGSFIADAAGVVDLGASRFFAMPWYPVASAVGGLMFGYGMALTGACGLTALARAGSGDLRALVIVLVIAISAYMAIGGPTAALRDAIWPLEGGAMARPNPGLANMLGAASGLTPLAAALAIAAVLALPAILPAERLRTRDAAWATAVGLAVASGWALTGWMAQTSFDTVPVESHGFTGPTGQTLVYLMTSTGSALDFGVGSVAGVLAGSFAASMLRREFRWEACDDARELRRQICGAFLMGTGGVIALGCSIGQGLTAMSTLSLSAPVTLLAIVIGARGGLYILVERPAARVSS